MNNYFVFICFCINLSILAPPLDLNVSIFVKVNRLLTCKVSTSLIVLSAERREIRLIGNRLSRVSVTKVNHTVHARLFTSCAFSGAAFNSARASHRSHWSLQQLIYQPPYRARAASSRDQKLSETFLLKFLQSAPPSQRVSGDVTVTLSPVLSDNIRCNRLLWMRSSPASSSL